MKGGYPVSTSLTGAGYTMCSMYSLLTSIYRDTYGRISFEKTNQNKNSVYSQNSTIYVALHFILQDQMFSALNFTLLMATRNSEAI